MKWKAIWVCTVNLSYTSMRENILHFIWKHQYYKVTQAITDLGDSIQVLKQGNHNHDAGPDFEQARLNIGDVEWNGDVEIHVKSSDWNLHNHQYDPAYNKVILHVVWQKDKDVKRKDGTILPTLELKPLVEEKLLSNVDSLMNNLKSIGCSNQLLSVPDIVISDVIQRSLIKRLERKAEVALKELQISNGDWAEVAYRLFMRQMGMKVNEKSFYELALRVPYKLVNKYSHSLLSVEALLFGVSGLLETSKEDDYVRKLKKEFKFLEHKHIIDKQLSSQLWKFLRLRPSNFPTLRLAQSASLLTSSVSIFELFMSFSKVEDLVNKLKLNPSYYWNNHYRFGKESKGKAPAMGKNSTDLLLLNVVAPLLTAYGLTIDNNTYIDKALKITESLKPEKNRIIREWHSVEIIPRNGAESQGLIELYNEGCLKKKCLNCGIGYNILKSQ